MCVQINTTLLERIWRKCPSISNLRHHYNILTCISNIVFHHAEFEAEETAQKYLKLYWTLWGNKSELQKNIIKLHSKGFSHRTSWNAARSIKNKYKFHFKLLAYMTVDNLIPKMPVKSFKACFFLGFFVKYFLGFGVFLFIWDFF